jgi:hypothetical protein
MSRAIYTSTIPCWLEPPAAEEGSLDPLGFLAPAEKIADRLLPGVTVATRRARYLSFLCWGIESTDGNPKEIDRWEVALSVSEYLRNDGGSFLGKNLLGQLALQPGDSVPSRLHVQTARNLYSGLLRSCGLVAPSGEVSDLGRRIAGEFGRDMPRRRPRKARRCGELPGLSAIRPKERRWLTDALLNSTDEASRRLATRREVGSRALNSIRQTRTVAPLLAEYLAKELARQNGTSRALHEAAALELSAMPLTRLFFYLYQNEGRIRGNPALRSRFRPYQVRDTSPAMMLEDVIAHLQKSAALGSLEMPLDRAGILTAIYERHVAAKAESPWVSADWRPLRLGLQTKEPRQVHGYRLTAFAELLADLDEV